MVMEGGGGAREGERQKRREGGRQGRVQGGGGKAREGAERAHALTCLFKECA